VILLLDETDNILCQDGLCRRSVVYGTFPECAKKYRSISNAKVVARKRKLAVAFIDDSRVTVCGVSGRCVFAKFPNDVDFCKYDVKDFICEDFRETVLVVTNSCHCLGCVFLQFSRDSFSCD
jgi:hypothetical protein